jgi:hypothetical protein
MQESLGRIRDVIVSQQTAALVEQARDPYKPMNGYDHNADRYHKDSEDGGRNIWRQGDYGGKGIVCEEQEPIQVEPRHLHNTSGPQE